MQITCTTKCVVALSTTQITFPDSTDSSDVDSVISGYGSVNDAPYLIVWVSVHAVHVLIDRDIRWLTY